MFFDRLRPRHGVVPAKWLIAPLIAAATYGAVVFDVPLRAAFIISRPWMNGLAQQAQQSNASLPNKSRVGAFSARNIHTKAGGVCFEFASGGFLTTTYVGFLYCPRGTKPPENLLETCYDVQGTGTVYRRFDDNWVHWAESDTF